MTRRAVSEADYGALLRASEKLLTYLTVIQTGTIENAAHFAPLAREEAEVVRRLVVKLDQKGRGS